MQTAMRALKDCQPYGFLPDDMPQVSRATIANDPGFQRMCQQAATNKNVCLKRANDLHSLPDDGGDRIEARGQRAAFAECYALYSQVEAMCSRAGGFDAMIAKAVEQQRAGLPVPVLGLAACMPRLFREPLLGLVPDLVGYDAQLLELLLQQVPQAEEMAGAQEWRRRAPGGDEDRSGRNRAQGSDDRKVNPEHVARVHLEEEILQGLHAHHVDEKRCPTNTER